MCQVKENILNWAGTFLPVADYSDRGIQSVITLLYGGR
jgi:hypothetical protein